MSRMNKCGIYIYYVQHSSNSVGRLCGLIYYKVKDSSDAYIRRGGIGYQQRLMDSIFIGNPLIAVISTRGARPFQESGQGIDRSDFFRPDVSLQGTPLVVLSAEPVVAPVRVEFLPADTDGITSAREISRL